MTVLPTISESYSRWVTLIKQIVALSKYKVRKKKKKCVKQIVAAT